LQSNDMIINVYVYVYVSKIITDANTVKYVGINKCGTNVHCLI
jgi:hypothetical protein